VSSPMPVHPVKDVRLEPVTPTDILALYEIASVCEARWLRVCGQGLPPFPDFEARFYANVLASVMIRRDDEYLGVCSLYDVDQQAGSGWLEVIRLPAADGEVDPSWLAAQMCAMAKTEWDLRRLHLAHVAFEPGPLSELPGMVEEARFPQAFLWESFYWDIVVTTITL
jgi:hypothetical protein